MIWAGILFYTRFAILSAQDSRYSPFFGVMKNEMYYGLEDTHKSFAEFKKAVDEYIAGTTRKEYVEGAGTNRPSSSERNGANHANQLNRLKRDKKVDTYQPINQILTYLKPLFIRRA